MHAFYVEEGSTACLLCHIPDSGNDLVFGACSKEWLCYSLDLMMILIA